MRCCSVAPGAERGGKFRLCKDNCISIYRVDSNEPISVEKNKSFTKPVPCLLFCCVLSCAATFQIAELLDSVELFPDEVLVLDAVYYNVVQMELFFPSIKYHSSLVVSGG